VLAFRANRAVCTSVQMLAAERKQGLPDAAQSGWREVCCGRVEAAETAPYFVNARGVAPRQRALESISSVVE
jgi:hypothetical protein